MLKMATTRKFSHFRQLSLTCDSPSPHQKRKTLKKQYSEDVPDFKPSWFEDEREIRVSLNNKLKKNQTDRPPPLRIAWSDKNENSNMTDDTVIIKKCKEVKKVANVRLTRHASLEKDSILNSKQDLTERFRQKNEHGEKENDKAENRTNLQIFLAPNAQDSKEEYVSQSDVDLSDSFLDKSQPKYLQPLITNMGDKVFQIRKNSNRKTINSPKLVDSSQKRPNFSRSNTIVVVPLVEKDKNSKNNSDNPIDNDTTNDPENNDELKSINVIIRPVTAQSRREKFQKRANSAFHGTLTTPQQPNFRPPLVRSSSAPSSRPEKSKFLATKRKLKTCKKFNGGKNIKDEDVSANVREWKNAGHTGSEIVTMVSLISPSGSDNEECSEEEAKETPKSVLKRENSVSDKSGKDEGASKDIVKNLSLRKTVKSVSFQQSSIHAVRSFSASFPARRASVATALILGNNGNGAMKTPHVTPKTNEKRTTNPSSPDADERVPKRRLVRSNTEEPKVSLDQPTASPETFPVNTDQSEASQIFTIDLQTKNNEKELEEKVSESSMRLNLEENVILITSEKKEEKCEEKTKEEPTSCETPKEKQCWAMYRKMTEKGINVSYDTILRGMLTPTEYRMRRRTSIAEEMNLLVNPPSHETAEETTKTTTNTK